MRASEQEGTVNTLDRCSDSKAVFGVYDWPTMKVHVFFPGYHLYLFWTGRGFKTGGFRREDSILT